MALALAGAMAFGIARTLGKVPDLRPVLNDEWVFWGAVFAPLLGVVPLGLPRFARPFAIAAPFLAFGAVATWLMLGNAVENGFAMEAPAWASIALCVLAIAVPWGIAQWATIRAETSEPPAPQESGRWDALPGLLALGLLVGVLTGGMFYSRSTKGIEIAATAGLVGGSLAVAWLGATLLGRFNWRPPAMMLVAALVVPLNALLWLKAFAYDSAPLISAALGVLAPVGLVVLLVSPIARAPIWARCLATCGAVVALAAAATAIAAKENRREDDLYGRAIEFSAPSERSIA